MKTVPAHFETCGLSSLFIMTMSQASRAAKVPGPAGLFGSRGRSIFRLRNSDTHVGNPRRKRGSVSSIVGFCQFDCVSQTTSDNRPGCCADV